jgi:hypothetical protein
VSGFSIIGHFQFAFSLVTIAVISITIKILMALLWRMLQVQARFKTIDFKSKSEFKLSYVNLSVSLVRSLERGGVSELSQAQVNRLRKPSGCTFANSPPL